MPDRGAGDPAGLRQLKVDGVALSHVPSPECPSEPEKGLMKRYLHLLFATASVSPVSAHAALLRFDFEAALNVDIGEICDPEAEGSCGDRAPDEWGLPAGTAFTGSWTVDTDATGIAISEPTRDGTREGKSYPLVDFRLTLGGVDVAFEFERGGLGMTSEPVPDYLRTIWTTGFTSDYTLFSRVAGGEVLVGGVPLFYAGVSFSHDGNTLWTADFTQPQDGAFIAAMTLAGFVDLRFNTGGPNWRVAAGIKSVKATVLPPTPVPIPAPAALLASGLCGFFLRQRPPLPAREQCS